MVYLAATPGRYEAVAQIAMAQISVASNNINPMGVNIEEPPLLIVRLSSPTSFPQQALDSCGVDKGLDSAAALSKSIRLALPKGVSNLVELKTFGKTPEVASTCAFAIFELIKTTQAQIVAPYMADVKNKLDDDIERLARAKDVVAKADKSGSAVGAAYLSTRDEIRFLLDEITILKNILASSQIKVAKLISPIYASDTPVAPNKRVVLASGVLGGLFLGLMLALGCQIWTKLKVGFQKQMQGEL